MKKYILLSAAFLVLFFSLIWIFSDNQAKFYSKLLKNEAVYRDSIINIITSLRNDREILEMQIDSLSLDLKNKTDDLKQTIKRLKITVNVPKTDYSNYSDTALIIRLLSN